MSAVGQQAPSQNRTPRNGASQAQYLLLPRLSWQGYLTIGVALADRPALRITYDGRDLEIMTTSFEHEYYKKCLSRLIETLAEELNRPHVSGGNMTFQREELVRGLEADDCFWIEHEPQMRGKKTWDPTTDPPPDLVTEIEISRSALDRLAIFAALRVPEVWCFDGDALRVYCLETDQTYRLSDHSPTFPMVPLAEIARFLNPSEATDNLTLLRAFRARIRELLGKKDGPSA